MTHSPCPEALFSIVAVVAALATTGCGHADGTPVSLPAASPGIGFDDLGFAKSLLGGRVLVPGGRSGLLDLVDPDTMAVVAIGGFSASSDYDGGHDDGPTSADAGGGYVFVTDRTTRSVSAVDPGKGQIVATLPLGATPDYVRWVEATGELWITEPGAERIEIIAFTAGDPPKLAGKGVVPIAGGPESLVVDQQRGRAYTHEWDGRTLAVDVKSRGVLWRADNGCRDSRGIAVDAQRGIVFAACAEGLVTAMSANAGNELGDLAEGSGVDVVGYSATLAHLYVAGGRSATLGVVGVSRTGTLTLLGDLETADGARCATADDRGHAWVCDPEQGRLLRFDDPFPQSGL